MNLQATPLDEFEAIMMIVIVLTSFFIIATLASLAIQKARDHFKKKIESLYGKEEKTKRQDQRKDIRGKF